MQIYRFLIEKIRDHLSAREITMLIGARQVGKTTLLKALMEELKAKNERCLFFNLDIERDAYFFASQERLLQKIKMEFGDAHGYVFMDEIQRKENAGIFLKGLYDRDLPYKFVVTGSGSLELKEKVHESLAGRKRMFELGPVSFLEFIHYKTSYRYKDSIQSFIKLETELVHVLLIAYLNYGGFPRVVTEPQEGEKRHILAEIFQSYIERDIAYLLGIERPEAFSLLIRLLAAQIGQLINYSALAIQSGLSLPTVKKYLWYAEKTFSLSVITPFFRNAQKELTKSPQVYFTDLGFRNYALNLLGHIGDSYHTGFLFQNFIFSTLKEHVGENGWKLNFWRTKDKAEVDFIIHQGLTPIPVEVKYQRLTKAAISRSFRSFIKRYTPPKAFLINLELEERIKIDSTEVHVIPYYHLLNKEFWENL